MLELALPGLVFLGICVWLVRKLVKAARTEGDLEAQRLEGALAQELQAGREGAAAAQRPPLAAVPDPKPMEEPASPATGGARRAEHPMEEPASPATGGARRAEHPMDGADVALADPEHLLLVEQLATEREQQLRAQHPAAAGRRVEVLWVRSNATHAVWCERRHAASPAARARDVICVAQIEKGAVVERWYFG
jgi:hypothetical protein